MKPQSPSKTGFRLAAKASYALRKSRVCMQIACALASISIALSRPTAHSSRSIFLVIPWANVGPEASCCAASSAVVSTRSGSASALKKPQARPSSPDIARPVYRSSATRAVAQVRERGDDRARAGAHAVHGGDDRLRAVAHRLDQIARHARKLKQPGFAHLRERPDDLVHIAAGAEIAAGARHDHRLDVACGAQAAEQIPQLAVGFEGERILLFRPIERDHADAALGAPLEMLRSRESGFLHAPSFRSVIPSAWLFTLASSRNSSACSLRLKPESTETIHSSCARAILPNASSPARVRRTRKARRSPGSGRRSTSLSLTSWSTMPVTFPPVTIRWCESSFILRPSG